MAEYTNNPIQTVPVGQDVMFAETAIPCTKGYVLHREGSGLFTLRGMVNGSNGCFARYKISFGSNIAVPEGQTVGPIQLAIAISGEAIQTSQMIETPAAVDEYNNIYGSIFITVSRGCCTDISVRNSGTIPVNVQNANLIVERVA